MVHIHYSCTLLVLNAVIWFIIALENYGMAVHVLLLYIVLLLMISKRMIVQYLSQQYVVSVVFMANLSRYCCHWVLGCNGLFFGERFWEIGNLCLKITLMDIWIDVLKSLCVYVLPCLHVVRIDLLQCDMFNSRNLLVDSLWIYSRVCSALFME